MSRRPPHTSRRPLRISRRPLHGVELDAGWLLRLVLVGVVAFELATGAAQGALVAGEGLLVSLLPLLVQRLSGIHIPRPLELAFVLGMTLQFTSEATKLFEVLYYWDKIVHPSLVALTTMLVGWLLLGYRDTFGGRLPTHLIGLFTVLVGACIGAAWEFVEFASDWFGDANLQKSSADTMTDLLANDIGAFAATLLGQWLYVHRFDAAQRKLTGELARWLANGPSRILDRFGRPIGAGFALAFVGIVGTGLWIDRDPPPLPTGLTGGETRVWTFSAAGAPEDAQPLLGDWVPDPRGTCRVNLEHPRPGSEKMGLLLLSPGKVYGSAGQSFSITAHFFAERPPPLDGTQMDAGVAFGIRDKQDFYLVEQSPLHDILRLDRFIHARRRDVREKLYRTHGNEWHTLQATVSGDRVVAGIDGQTIYEVRGLADTAGGIGLWARTSAASCFDRVEVQVGAPMAADSVPWVRL